MTLADFLPEVEVYERGIRRGREEGREEGRHQEKIEMARAFLLKGIDMGTVASVTQLDESELKEILN